MLHLEDFSDHYSPTLAAWRENFFAHLAEIRGLGFDERFIQMWNDYLCGVEFLERQIGGSQLVSARSGQFTRRCCGFERFTRGMTSMVE